MQTKRYSELVDPQNAGVRELTAEALGARSVEAEVAQALRVESLLTLLKSFKYINESGMTSLDEVAATRAGNCLSLICLLCSLLRHAGFSASEAFAAVGCPKGFHLIEIHAYAIVRCPDKDQLLLIDPVSMNGEAVTYEHLRESYSVFVVFNDRVQASDGDGIRDLLSGTPLAEGALASRGIGCEAYL